MTLLTIFTAPKPFTNPHIAIIQRNAIRSWLELGAEVQVLIMGREDGLQETANELGVCCIAGVERNSSGTPLVSSIFDLARQNSHSPLLACVNADILLLPDFIASATQVADQVKDFLIVGQRWDLDVNELLSFNLGWADELINQITSHGKLHPRGGSDYFIFPRHCYTGIPDFAIGRAGWDNWMIYEARHHGWRVVDATQANRIVHQNHDYSHLPNGQPHYRLPETEENVRMAGGPRTVFTLLDADRQLTDGKLQNVPLSLDRFLREIEIFPLIRLRSKALANIFFAIFHPHKAYRDFRGWLRRKK